MKLGRHNQTIRGGVEMASLMLATWAKRHNGHCPSGFTEHINMPTWIIRVNRSTLCFSWITYCLEQVMRPWVEVWLSLTLHFSSVKWEWMMVSPYLLKGSDEVKHAAYFVNSKALFWYKLQHPRIHCLSWFLFLNEFLLYVLKMCNVIFWYSDIVKWL